MKEEVVLKTHHFLKFKGLNQQTLVRIYTDAHNTLLPYKNSNPFKDLRLISETLFFIQT